MVPENRIAVAVARSAYRPAVSVAEPPPTGLVERVRRALRPGTAKEIFLGFYSDPVARLALVVSAVVLAYGGGAIMFWFHAIYLGEGGPAIGNWTHWLLDSTVGFFGLLPAIALLLPATAWLAVAPGKEAGRSTVHPLRYALLGGAGFAFITAPGPLLHNALVGRGTWLANQVTDMWGNGQVPGVAPAARPPLEEMGIQVLAGLPTYIPMMLLALILVRGMASLAKSAQRSALATQGEEFTRV